MNIPIQNIYYLLCYAWNRLEEGQRVAVSASDYKTALELLSRVLLSGCNVLFKRGLDRAYIERKESYAGIKGKIDFSASLSASSFRSGKAICDFDEFEYDVLQNQIIKSTLSRLSQIKGIDRSIGHEAWRSAQNFRGIAELQIRLSDFSRVRIHRNNSIYDFLLRVCRLIFESTSLDESDGKYHFKSFTDNEKAMAALFENFVRNFYRKETEGVYAVTSDDIRWAASSLTSGGLELLPKMRTDVTLRSRIRKIVLDTKYYSQTLSDYRGTEKVHSTNLYQMYSYLRNLEAGSFDPLDQSCEGILLYPTVQKEVDESFEVGGHKVRIATVNLESEWRDIHKRLLHIVDFC